VIDLRDQIVGEREYSELAMIATHADACPRNVTAGSGLTAHGSRSPHPDKRALSGESNQAATASLYFMYYNFGGLHQTLRVTPAMETGRAGHVWSIEEFVGLLG
jgi:hypothetical protein